MARILGIGIATLDIINTVDGYPAEDSELRAIEQSFVRGGNVCNTLVVLSRLGHEPFWAGTLAQDCAAAIIEQDLQLHQVNMQYYRRVDHSRTPVSCILRNARNGSRSIVHYRDLPELKHTDFQNIPLDGFDWLHFEARAIEELVLMLQRVRQRAPGLPVSIEIEKPRDRLERLFPYGNVLLFSRNYAQSCGFNEAAAFLRQMQTVTAGQLLICAWGKAGAYALQNGELYHSPAFPPAQIVDTLGAGDTFNAAVIDAQLRGMDVERMLAGACRLAGAKCARAGFEHLHAGMTQEQPA